MIAEQGRSYELALNRDRPEPIAPLGWKPLGISQYRLAKDIAVSPRRVNEIVHGKRAISADTALRLSRYFGMSERFWINLQGRYDIEMGKDLLADRLDREVRPRAASCSRAS